jgi:hypothetical protein
MREYLAAEFLSDIPTESKECTYTKEQARAFYEEHRKTILAELKIRETQRRATSKLLGRKKDGMDLLFYKRNIEDLDDGMSDVLSEGYGTENNEEAGDSPRPVKSGTSESRVPQIEDISSDSEELELRPGRKSTARHAEHDPEGYNVRNLLDLEAEVSGESDGYGGTEDDAGCRDDPDLIAPSDEEYEAPIEKHNEDILQMNEELLRKLEERFVRRPKDKKFFGKEEQRKITWHNFSSDEEEFSSGGEEEIGNMDDEFMFQRAEGVEYATEAVSIHSAPEAVEFRPDPGLAERKLGKKKEGLCFELGDKNGEHVDEA